MPDHPHAPGDRANADDAAELAHRLWRTTGVPGELSQELRTPAHFAEFLRGLGELGPA